MDTTIRQEIRQWWKQVIEAGEQLDPKVLARRAVAELGQNQALLARWFEETAYQTIYEVGLSLLSQQRSAIVRESRVHDAGAARRVLSDHLDRHPADFEKWMERDPATGVQVPLLDMLKEQVLAAKQVRRASNMEGFRREAFLGFVAGRLRDGQRVRDAWNDDLLTDLMARVEVKTTFSLKGVTKPDPSQEAAD